MLYVPLVFKHQSNIISNDKQQYNFADLYFITKYIIQQWYKSLTKNSCNLNDAFLILFTNTHYKTLSDRRNMVNSSVTWETYFATALLHLYLMINIAWSNFIKLLYFWGWHFWLILSCKTSFIYDYVLVIMTSFYLW